MGKCPHCGSSKIQKRYREHRRYNWRCRTCNRVFRRPRRSAVLWLGVLAVIVVIAVGTILLQQSATPGVKQYGVNSALPSSSARDLLTPVGNAVGKVDAAATSVPNLTPPARSSATPVPAHSVAKSHATLMPTSTPTVRPSGTELPAPTSMSANSLAFGSQSGATLEAANPSANILREFENGGWVIHNEPQNAAAIAALQWVADGIDSSESEGVQSLVSLAAFHTKITTSLINQSWLRDDITSTESDAVQFMKYLASDSEPTARQVIELPWFEDGVTEAEAAAIDSVAFIAQKNGSIALRVSGLPWFADGITENEAAQLKYYNHLVKDSESAALQVLEISWFRDDVVGMEVKAVDGLSFIALGSGRTAELVTGTEWFLDGVDERESGSLVSLAYIAKYSEDLAERIARIDWLSDGLDAHEARGLKDLSYLVEDSQVVAGRLVDMPWFVDGINTDEARGIEYFKYLLSSSRLAAGHVVERAWLQDGLTLFEIGAIDNLAFLAQSNPAASSQVAQMSFLDSVEPVDISALKSLDGLATDSPSLLRHILDHRSLSRGITDDLAPVISVLDGVARTNPSLVKKLLEPGAVDVERRSIELALVGEVDLAILRTSRGASRSMDYLEYSVRSAESIVGQPFPTRYVGLLYEKAVSGGYAGTNFGTHIAILPEYDTDEEGEEAQSAFGNIAHEVAHYYWSGNTDWIDEGLAEFMTSAMESERTGKPIGVLSGPCPSVRSIVALEALAPDADEDPEEFGCNYSLGQRLFTDLYRTLGGDVTLQRFGELYVASQASGDSEETSVTGADISHVRQVFGSIPGAAVPIARWYDGSVGYDTSQIDAAPIDPALPSINGRIDEAYVTLGDGKKVASSFSLSDVADDAVWLNLEYSYNISGERRGQTLNVLSFYEDGFAFEDSYLEIEAESRNVGGTTSVWIGPSKVVPGRYWVYVYEGDRKVAEVRYDVLQ